MKNIFWIIIGCSCFCVACRKSPYHDLGGTETIKGVVILYDTLSGRVNKTSASGILVYLKYASDATGFLYSVKTDSQGKYSFAGISADSSYKIYARSELSPLMYYGELSLIPSDINGGRSDSLKLFPDISNQNGIHLIIEDEVGQRVGNLTAWVFNNPVLFTNDSSTGRIFDIVTNQYGVGNAFNLVADDYYLRIRARTPTSLLLAEKTVRVSGNGIENVILTVNSVSNGIEFFTNDASNLPIVAARTYFYRSPIVRDLDSTFANSEFTLTSDAAGRATVYMIDPAVYYFHSVKTIRDTSLNAKGNMTVSLNQVSSKVVQLY